MTNINTPKKSAVSLQTQYDAAKAVAAKAIAAQKLSQNVATLNATNKSLQAQISQPQGRGYSIKEQLVQYNDAITYEQTMVVKNVWGTDTNQNHLIMQRAGTSNDSGTLTIPDKNKIIDDITYLQGEALKLQTKINGLQKAIDSNTKLINSEKKTLKTSTSTTTLSTKAGNKGTQTQTSTPAPEFPTSDYLWNLPPHKWSLPVDPYTIAPDTTNKRTDSFHATRRGRIWYYNGYVGPTNIPDYANTGTPSGQNPVTVNKYGFQFVWNPETFSQNTSVNMNVTPSGSDPSVALTGFAAANSTMGFTLRLDRTNDFTSMRGGDSVSKAIAQKNKDNALANQTISTVNSALGNNAYKLRPIVPVFDPSWLKYYTDGLPTTTSDTALEQKIVDLLTYGTEADLEYLYRTVNGSGWKGIGGRDTSNIGYLMPALIRIDLGQQKFVGVVSSVSVNHLAFTRDMVPIRTDVDITVDLRANIQPQTNNGAVGK
jgi:hypothetical protein